MDAQDHKVIEHYPRQPAHLPLADWKIVLHRMKRVLRFDGSIYADTARDPTATRQAGWVVGMVTAAAAIGTALITGWEPGAIAGAALAAVAHWLLWTGLISLIAITVFHSTTSLQQLLSAMGYAQTPQVIAILGFIPVVGPMIVLLSRLLSAVAGAQAMRNTSHLERRQRIATNVLAFVVSLVVTTLMKAWLGDLGSWQALTSP